MRWNIEVMNKECKQYLELGKYQGRDFDGQIADSTLCSITYTLLALDKRFSEYETMGELFGQHREDLMALTLWRRILEMIIAILEALCEVMSFNIEELTENILNNEAAAKRCEFRPSHLKISTNGGIGETLQHGMTCRQA